MSDEITKKMQDAFRSINEEQEMHLVESIISLFHQGVLRHYVHNPRQNFDNTNCTMTIELATGVTFNGREKLVEMEQEITTLKGTISDLMGRLKVFEDKAAEDLGYYGYYAPKKNGNESK